MTELSLSEVNKEEQLEADASTQTTQPPRLSASTFFFLTKAVLVVMNSFNKIYNPGSRRFINLH